MGKEVTRKQVIDAAQTILNYCNEFDEDTENRRELMKKNELPEGVKDFSQAFEQLENHRSQENIIATIRSYIKEIHRQMERITYRNIYTR